LEEPVGDGRLVVGGEGELLSQAVQVLDRLGRNVIKVDLKSSNVQLLLEKERMLIYNVTSNLPNN
jgi:hypothetical protein